MQIIDAKEEKDLNRQMAEILLDGFSDTGTEGWSTMEECEKEVADSLDDQKISRIAIDESNSVLGWTIGGRNIQGLHVGTGIIGGSA